MIASSPIASSPLSGPPATPGGSGTAADGGTVAGVWGIQVLVNGIDLSADVVGEVVVEAEEGAARIADLTLCPATGSIIDVPGWTGKPVIVRFVNMHTGVPTDARVLFSGIVDLPSVDMVTRLLKLRCTDDLQGRLAALSKAEINTLVGGLWSAAVFSAAASTYIYAQDRLSTRPASVDLSPVGDLRLTEWAAKVAADLEFTADEIIEGSIAPQLAERAGLTNRVDLTFNYRFPRQKAEGYEVNYDYLALHSTSFGYWVRDGGSFLQRAATLAAIEKAGGSVVSADWIALPTTAQVIPGSGGSPAGVWLPNPATDPELCLGFSIVVAFDYGQDIDETYTITVHNEASIAELGVVRETMTGALQGEYGDPVAVETNVLLYKNKISSIPPKNLAPVVVGLTNSANVTLTTDSDRAAAEAAMEVLIAIAKVKIFASARRNRVAASVPLNCSIDVDKTISVDASGVLAKGKVARVVHRLQPDSGRAVSDFELAICSVAGVGVTHPEDETVAPDGSSDGATTALDAPEVTWNGLFGEDQVITIDFPGVADAERAKAAVAITRTYRAPLIEDVFTITL